MKIISIPEAFEKKTDIYVVIPLENNEYGFAEIYLNEEGNYQVSLLPKSF